jgi:hypothetical protein
MGPFFLSRYKNNDPFTGFNCPKNQIIEEREGAIKNPDSFWFDIFQKIK